MMPNSMKVLRRSASRSACGATSFEPYSHLNRQWDTGEVMRELPMPESLFGAPYLCMHRGDLHEALAAVLPGEIVHLGKKLAGSTNPGSVTLRFDDGNRAEADACSAPTACTRSCATSSSGRRADSQGRIAYRAVFPSALLGGKDVGRSRTKWWGIDRHIVIYYTRRDRSEVYFVTSVPDRPSG